MKCAARIFLGISIGIMPLAIQASQGLKIGPATKFDSSIAASYMTTDNFYRANDNEVDASGFLLTPFLGVTYAPTIGEYSLSYRGELGEFDAAGEDDYFDQQVTFESSIRPLTRHAIDFTLAYEHEHDAFGTVRTSGQNRFDDRDLDKWDGLTADMKYTFGAPSADLNWHIRGTHYDQDYTTNEIDPTNPATGTRFLDRQEQSIGTGLTYKLTPRSKLLFDISRTDIDYDTDLAQSLDGSLDKALVGIRWLATAKTSGEVYVGAFSREFDDSGREESDGGTWAAEVTWSPRTYSNITFATGQSVLPAILFGENYINRQQASVRWDHSWTVRFSTFARYEFLNDDYEGSFREDDTSNFGLGGQFELYKFYSVSLSVTGVDRDSNNNQFDYDRTVFRLNFNATY